MSSLLWFVNRASAAVLGLIVVSFALAAANAPVALLQCGRLCTDDLPNVAAVGLWLAYATAYGLLMALPVAIVLGILPAIAALTITPAATRPWQALPTLLIASLVGVGICWCFLVVFRVEYGATEVAMLVCIPSLTGLLAAWKAERLWRFAWRGSRSIHG